MIICLNECQKNFLKCLLSLYYEREEKRRLHFKKSEIEELFNINYNCFSDIVYSLKISRFIDIPFENNLQIDIYIYKEMIEEQLDKNTRYVKVHKEWLNSIFFDKND